MTNQNRDAFNRMNRVWYRLFLRGPTAGIKEELKARDWRAYTDENREWYWTIDVPAGDENISWARTLGDAWLLRKNCLPGWGFKLEVIK